MFDEFEAGSTDSNPNQDQNLEGKCIFEWTEADVKTWLQNGFQQHVHLFAEYTGQDIANLRKSDMSELSISMPVVNRLFNRVSTLLHEFMNNMERNSWRTRNFVAPWPHEEHQCNQPVGKSQKISQFLNYRMKITLSNLRTIIGTFLAFDKHMNLVLGDAEEFRTLKGKKGQLQEREEKRPLGLIILRGENVVALSVEGPPPNEDKRTKATASAGPGLGRAAGRGVTPASMVAAPAGLSGPARGLGGPSSDMMAPGGAPPMGMPPGMMGRGAPPGMPPGMGGPPPGMMGRGGPPPGFGGPPPGMMGRGGPPPGFGGPPPGFQQ